GVKDVVLLGRHRAIYIIVATLAIAGRFKGDRHIYRVSRDDRGDRIIKIKLVVTRQPHDLLGQGVRGKRSGRYYADRIRRDLGDLFAADLDIWVGRDALGDHVGKFYRVDRQSGPGRHTGGCRYLHYQRT